MCAFCKRGLQSPETSVSYRMSTGTLSTSSSATSPVKEPPRGRTHTIHACPKALSCARANDNVGLRAGRAVSLGPKVHEKQVHGKRDSEGGGGPLLRNGIGTGVRRKSSWVHVGVLH